ncbi:response regulator transcription factor [Mycolicibacterium fortuitum]|uniref:response regulator transcription factor n=1 Tax=Mycolicibacterium fortuitum TaxID=1766 RepID=UPI0027E0A948|nr:LuxR C-terminal-related transcriptional regulator [Mycolicibacterium fortuitum]
MTACLVIPHTTAQHGGTPAAGSVRGPADGRSAGTGPTGRVQLSDREREILVTWLKTDSKTAVAQRLYLTPSTVRTYLQRIREKYDRVGRPARTKAALAARAIQDGYIRLDEL